MPERRVMTGSSMVGVDDGGATRSSPAPDMTKAARSGGLLVARLRYAQRIRAASKRPTTGFVADVGQARALL
jgi:hypothetical protein